MNAKQMLVDFVAKSDAFTPDAKVKLLLVIAGVKPATYVPLMISPKNIDDKRHFEKHLKELGLEFIVANPKSFEMVKSIEGSKIKWAIEGVWYGYDILENEKYLKMFRKYKQLAKARKMVAADKLGGLVYGYPACCVKQFLKERDVRNIPAQFSYSDYFKRMHEIDWKFPFLSHVPHSSSCTASKALNSKYAAAVRKTAPEFYRKFTKKRTVRVPLIINHENDLLWRGQSVWDKKNAHDYTAITARPVERRFITLSFLSKKIFGEGDVIGAVLTLQYNAIAVSEGKKVGHLKNLYHERKFAV